jgi:hypothetical protein
MRGVNSCKRQLELSTRWVKFSYLDVFGQKPVEQMWVGGLEVDEVLKFLNWRRLHGEES